MFHWVEFLAIRVRPVLVFVVLRLFALSRSLCLFVFLFDSLAHHLDLRQTRSPDKDFGRQVNAAVVRELPPTRHSLFGRRL